MPLTTPQTFADGDPVDVVTPFTLQCMYAKLLIDMFLCGIYTMQLIHYLKYHMKDRLWIRCVVAGTSILTYFISAYVIRYVFNMFVDDFGTTQLITTTFLAWYPLLDAMTSSLVQGFFAHRCWRITNRSKVITGFLIFCIFSSVVCACVFTGQAFRMDTYLEIREARPTIILWLVFIVSADVVITSAILYGLLKNRTGWEHTDKVIRRLVRLTLESQTPPTLLATVFLIAFLIVPRSDIHFIWQGVQSKFYVIGLMFSLNSRDEFAPRNLTMTGTNVGEGIAVEVEVETFQSNAEDWECKRSPNRSTWRDEEAEAMGEVAVCVGEGSGGRLS